MLPGKMRLCIAIVLMLFLVCFSESIVRFKAVFGAACVFDYHLAVHAR